AVKLGQPHRVSAAVQGNRVVVTVDGQEKIRYIDDSPLPAGAVGVGASSQAAVTFEKVEVEELPALAQAAVVKHEPRFSWRRWLGGRPWVFDGDEPILLLPVPAASTINNVKLRPGLKPTLSGPAPGDPPTRAPSPGAHTPRARARAPGGGNPPPARGPPRQNKARFAPRTALKVGGDARRSVYTYDVES